MIPYPPPVPPQRNNFHLIEIRLHPDQIVLFTFEQISQTFSTCRLFEDFIQKIKLEIQKRKFFSNTENTQALVQQSFKELDLLEHHLDLLQQYSDWLHENFLTPNEHGFYICPEDLPGTNGWNPFSKSVQRVRQYTKEIADTRNNLNELLSAGKITIKELKVVRARLYRMGNSIFESFSAYMKTEALWTKSIRVFHGTQTDLTFSVRQQIPGPSGTIIRVYSTATSNFTLTGQEIQSLWQDGRNNFRAYFDPSYVCIAQVNSNSLVKPLKFHSKITKALFLKRPELATYWRNLQNLQNFGLLEAKPQMTHALYPVSGVIKPKARRVGPGDKSVFEAVQSANPSVQIAQPVVAPAVQSSGFFSVAGLLGAALIGFHAGTSQLRSRADYHSTQLTPRDSSAHPIVVEPSEDTSTPADNS